MSENKIVELAKKYAEENNIHDKNLMENEEIKKLYQAQIKKFGTKFKGYEKPKTFHLISEDWTTENGMLTPTMKLKRKIVFEKC